MVSVLSMLRPLGMAFSREKNFEAAPDRAWFLELVSLMAVLTYWTYVVLYFSNKSSGMKIL